MIQQYQTYGYSSADLICLNDHTLKHFLLGYRLEANIIVFVFKNRKNYFRVVSFFQAFFNCPIGTFLSTVTVHVYCPQTHKPCEHKP